MSPCTPTAITHLDTKGMDRTAPNMAGRKPPSSATRSSRSRKQLSSVKKTRAKAVYVHNCVGVYV
jgi:hypothetical protein